MLRVNYENRKGILFIRLKGSLLKNNCKSLEDYYVPLIINFGIKYVVFNFEYLNKIDREGKHTIDELIYWINYNNGSYLITNCKVNLNNYNFVSNELEALKILKI